MSKIYAFGSNGSGQLGIGHAEDTRVPTLCVGIPPNDTVKKISGGGNHSAIITESGALYMSGMSQFGEDHMKSLLKNTHEENVSWYGYQRRFEDKKWKDVACGWAFTLLIGQDDKLYGIGTSRWNELLRESTDELVEINHDELTDIVAVACGWRHVIVLDQQGQVYGWGWGKHGQLGPSKVPTKDKKDIRSLQKIDMPQPIVQVACGHLHTLLRGKDGTVYGFGSNKSGQMGSNENVIIKDNASYIDAGWHHSATLDEEGNVSLWGRNDHGQLGCETLPKLHKIFCGSEHTLAITKELSQVIAWGWNEHGNCTSDKDFVQSPVILEEFKKVYIIGAGCASSWFAISV